MPAGGDFVNGRTYPGVERRQSRRMRAVIFSKSDVLGGGTSNATSLNMLIQGEPPPPVATIGTDGVMLSAAAGSSDNDA